MRRLFQIATEPTLKEYTDARIQDLQSEIDRRFTTILREITMLVTNYQNDLANSRHDLEAKFHNHNVVHDREREALADFKMSSEQWRTAANEFRAQLTQERGDYLMRKEIWAMLAATGGVVVTIVTILHFVFTLHNGQ
jgi:hypothetical protein